MTAVTAPLRKPKAEDLPALASLFRDPYLRQHLGGPRDELQAMSSAEELIAIDRELPSWVIVRPGTLDTVGFVSLDRHHDGSDVEVSFVLATVAQGSGIGRLAVAAALTEAWALGLVHIVAETQVANARAARLLEALGFPVCRTFERFGAPQNLYSLQRPGASAA